MKFKVFYSPSLNGFFQTDFHKTIPSDGIEVSDKQRWELLSGITANKKISVQDGEVVLIDKEIDHSTLIKQERAWRDLELFNADYELNKVQDSDPNSVGSVSGWRSYRRELRGWPEHPEFPKKQFRPKSPIN